MCSRDYTTAKKVLKFEYDLLICFVVFSAICLGFSNDFLMLYLAIELQSLTFYVLATFFKQSEFSIEAGLKYFIFGGLMSCLLLLGLSLIYLFFGTITFEFLTLGTFDDLTLTLFAPFVLFLLSDNFAFFK